MTAFASKNKTFLHFFQKYTFVVFDGQLQEVI